MRKTYLAAAAAFALAGSAGVSDGATIWAIDQHNTLFSFDSANPAVIQTARHLNNVQNAQAIDFRPADNLLYILDATGSLFRLDVNVIPSGNQFNPSATLQQVTGLNGTSFGFDFNPVADRLRVTSDTDVNLSHEVGVATTVQTTLTAPYGNPTIVGSAYSNNFAGSGTTFLYNIDAGIDELTVQDPPAPGVQAAGGMLGVDVRSEELGFDIESGTNIAFMAANPAGQRDSVLYTVSLTVGTATSIGLIGQGILVRDIAVVIPEPSGMAMAAIGVTVLGRRRR
jgi:hypothetical protein